MSNNRWRVRHGAVQCCISRETPFAMIHFGRAEYDSQNPVLTELLKRQGEEIYNLLNAAEIDEAEAKQRLSKIYF